MATGAAFPIPSGTTASFAQVAAGANTPAAWLDAGPAVMTFQPYDVNWPGTVTLYDNTSGLAVGTLTSAGYLPFVVPPGGNKYYMTGTCGAAIFAITSPNSLR